MNKLTIRDLDLKGKRVFLRVDFNVPIQEGRITDDTRIRESLPTLTYAVDHGAIVVLASHLGRPKGERKPEFSLQPVAEHLSNLLGKPVDFVSECIGELVQTAVRSATPGSVLLLENLRFHKAEEKNDPDFARQLAEGIDLYVNDAFGSSHRAHASTEGITRHIKTCAAGLLMEKELAYLGKALTQPDRPFTAILGGAKVSDKIEVIENLIKIVDHLLIGGAMAYTFLKSQGRRIGISLCEDDKLELATRLLAAAGARSVRLQVPQDHVASLSLDGKQESNVVPVDIPDGWIGVDIGPQTILAYRQVVQGSRTILWNGPMGVFEVEPFARGTMDIARAVAEAKATSIVGGGDSVAAIHQSGVSHKITHISTGGGASLEFLSGKTLPGVAALTDKL
ncbi:MAG: phosphoglycerate kinase [Acidobacteria bacterium]|nr:phosphoglycerate kinase [Acidobacteriota bacterium]MBI3658663.1 phosphoglycerate kinase [Acidobacteriota bacterium]